MVNGIAIPLKYKIKRQNLLFLYENQTSDENNLQSRYSFYKSIQK